MSAHGTACPHCGRCDIGGCKHIRGMTFQLPPSQAGLPFADISAGLLLTLHQCAPTREHLVQALRDIADKLEERDELTGGSGRCDALGLANSWGIEDRGPA